MDTRTKILTLEAARALGDSRPVVVAGYFEILLAEHARLLDEVRRRHPAGPLVAFVMPLSGAILPAGARAEMAAGLRVIDYVVTGDDNDLATLVDGLQPAAVVRLEADEERLHRELAQHVRSRHGR